MGDLWDVVLVVGGVGLVVTTVVDVLRRGPGRIALESWADPSPVRTAFVVVVLVAVVAVVLR